MKQLGGTRNYHGDQWKIEFGSGHVDLSKLQPRRTGAQHTAAVDDAPFVVLSTAQILNGKLERQSRSPVRDVFDVIRACRLDANALAIAVNAPTRLTTEFICMAWE